MKWPLRNLSGYLLLPLSAILLAVGLLIYWLIATTPGADWTIRRALTAVPHGPQIQSISGTLSGGVTLTGVTFSAPTYRIHIASVAGQWRLSSLLGGPLVVEQLSVDQLTITLTGVESAPKPPAPWPSLASPIPLSINGNIRTLVIQQTDREPTRIDRVTVRALVSPFEYQVQELSIASADVNIGLTGTMASDFPYRHQLMVDWSLSTETQTYQGKGSLIGNLTKSTLHHQLQQPLPVLTQGHLGLTNRVEKRDFDPALFNYALATEWQELLVAIADTPVVSSGAITLTSAKGRYQLTGETQVEPASDEGKVPLWTVLANAERIPDSAFPVTIALNADGNFSGLDNIDAQIQTGTGAARLSGELGWLDGLRWQLAAATEQLNLAPFFPNWPAVLSGNIASAGQFTDQGLFASISTTDIEGTWRELPLQLQLAAQISPENFTLESLQAKVADNQLTGAGVIAEHSDIHWEINAPNINALAPNFHGSLVGRGRFSGTLDDPLLDTSLRGENLAIADWSLARLDLEASSDAARRINLAASLTALSGPGLKSTNATLEGSGVLGNHQIALTVSNKDMGASLSLNGAYRQAAWNGTVSQLRLTPASLATWQQSGSATVALASTDGEIDGSIADLCLTGTGEICIEGGYKDGQFNLAADIHELALSQLKPWLPERTELSGVANGRLTFTKDGTGQRGQFSLITQNGEMSYTNAVAEPLRHQAALNLEGSLSNQDARATAQFTINDTARLEANLATKLDGSYPLNGDITVAVGSLQWLEAFTTAIEAPTGQVQGRLLVSGNAKSPQVSGTLQLRDFTGQIPDTGVTLSDGSASLDIQPGGAWQLNGQVATPDGVGNISGSGLTEELWAGNIALALTGDNLTLINLPDTRILVSPNITLDFSKGRRNIRGEVAVPLADIKMRKLPEGAVELSSDENITPPLAQETVVGNISVKLKVILGDDVHIQGYGLDSRLAGNLNLGYNSDGTTTAKGRIELRKGTYEAYGQKLKITQGHLIFQGNLENPGLNIIALRETPTAEVGLRISGVLKQITSEVFSDPALPPSEAFILLVTGKPPNNLNETDANLVMNAAAALGFAQSDWITTKLQQKFGLDVVSLESGDTYEGSSLVVGKQLTPKLFVSYVQNLFSPGSSFVLQYQLSKNLGLQAESGEFHSIDINYRIEH